MLRTGRNSFVGGQRICSERGVTPPCTRFRIFRFSGRDHQLSLKLLQEAPGAGAVAFGSIEKRGRGSEGLKRDHEPSPSPPRVACLCQTLPFKPHREKRHPCTHGSGGGGGFLRGVGRERQAHVAPTEGSLGDSWVTGGDDHLRACTRARMHTHGSGGLRSVRPIHAHRLAGREEEEEEETRSGQTAEAPACCTALLPSFLPSFLPYSRRPPCMVDRVRLRVSLCLIKVFWEINGYRF